MSIAIQEELHLYDSFVFIPVNYCLNMSTMRAQKHSAITRWDCIKIVRYENSVAHNFLFQQRGYWGIFH